jgi:pyruvate/2-oxoacid:ferredoxin oxidoreductase alpha subunit
MTAKRRNKLKKLASELPVPAVYGGAEGQILLVSWGSSQGPVQEAVKLARAAGHAVSAVHIKYVHPLPPGLENIFAGFSHVFVVELNDEGFVDLGGEIATFWHRLENALHLLNVYIQPFREAHLFGNRQRVNDTCL